MNKQLICVFAILLAINVLIVECSPKGGSVSYGSKIKHPKSSGKYQPPPPKHGGGGGGGGKGGGGKVSYGSKIQHKSSGGGHYSPPPPPPKKGGVTVSGKAPPGKY